MSEISQGAVEIIKEARWVECDREKLKALIEEHGIDAAAEALDCLGRISSQIRN